MQMIFLTKLLKENMHKTKRIRYRSNLKRMPIYRAISGARTRSRTRQYFPFPPVSTKTIINLKGNFPCFLYSSSPKWRPIVAFQCLQTNTPQIAGLLTCSLFTFFNTRQKYWTLKRRIFETLKRRTWLVSVDSVSWKCLTHVITNNK